MSSPSAPDPRVSETPSAITPAHAWGARVPSPTALRSSLATCRALALAMPLWLVTISSPGAAEAGELAWAPERTYRFVWMASGEKRGESIVRFSKREVDGETRALLTFHRQRTDRGHHTNTDGKLWLNANGFPTSYREETHFSIASERPFRARQELRVEFGGNEVAATYINNGDETSAARTVVELAPRTHLFATHALEHWIIFCSDLGVPASTTALAPGDSSPSKIGPAEETAAPVSPGTAPKDARPPAEDGVATRRIFFPEFGQTVDLDLRRRDREEISLGTSRVLATRWDFEVAIWKFKGSVWVDDASRLLRYTSGPLEFVLDRRPGADTDQDAATEPTRDPKPGAGRSETAE